MYDFNKIAGNTHIIKSLVNSIENNMVSHAYIFHGDSGMGKMTLALTFAKTLLCERNHKTPCNECSSCLMFDSGNNPDLITIRKSKSKTIGVDDIREQINSETSIKPYRFQRKIFIIPHGEELSQAAQNALLKTLEQAHRYCVFLFTVTNLAFILPTVLSRCIVFRLNPLSLDIIQSHLEHRFPDADKNQIVFASSYANGSIGKSIKILFDEQFIFVRNLVISILDQIYEKELWEIFNCYKKIDEIKDHFEDVLDISFLWYRDLAILKGLDRFDFIVQKDLTNKLRINADSLSLQSIYENLNTILDARFNLRFHANFQLNAEVMLMKLNENQ